MHVQAYFSDLQINNFFSLTTFRCFLKTKLKIKKKKNATHNTVTEFALNTV